MSDARIHYRGPGHAARVLIEQLEGEGLAVSHGPMIEGPMIATKGADVVHDVVVWVGAGSVESVAAEGLKARIRAVIRRFRGSHPQADVMIVE